jgi:type I restriction enzyme M protein
MAKGDFGRLVSFIFGIANDCLVDVYDVGDYRKIILPMIVLRRFDAVLEPTKQKVLAMKKNLDANRITDQDEALCAVAGEAFCNSSPYTLSDLKSRTNQQQLKADFILYLDGFSKNVQDIIKKFEFRNQIDKLSEHDILGLLISKFTDPSINLSSRPVTTAAGVTLPALDNHTMGTVFEEVIRKFNEETNITDAGRHFTPRDIVELITDLAFVPVKDQIKNTTYRIYDGACGTGGMLTVAEQRIRQVATEQGKRVSIYLYGQENADETYAIAKSDMLLKGEGSQSNNLFFGSTISNDGFSGETFDFCLSNPPFGTPWKTDLKAWGDIKKEDIADSRFVVSYQGQNFSLIPDIGDPQMLFLANNISKMKRDTPLGTRIVEVHNGSSLFTGKAGQGPSNLRQYIIEQDLLECIVAVPEKMFYNTGIGTYLWILSNKKEARRKGKVQLIDATSFKKPLRKNLGEKNCEVTEEIRRQILDLYMAFDAADPKYSRVFPNSEFGYWEVPVYTPRLDESGNPIVDKKGKPVKPDSDKEQVPFSYEGGITAFIENEVKPYAPLAYIVPGTEKVGYELSFAKYFYQPVQLRTLEEITADIRAIEAETDGLLDEIIGGRT